MTLVVTVPVKESLLLVPQRVLVTKLGFCSLMIVSQGQSSLPVTVPELLTGLEVLAEVEDTPELLIYIACIIYRNFTHYHCFRSRRGIRIF